VANSDDLIAWLGCYPARPAPLDWLPASSLRMKAQQAGLHLDAEMQADLVEFQVATDLFAVLRFGEERSDEDGVHAARLTHHIHKLQSGIEARIKAQRT